MAQSVLCGGGEGCGLEAPQLHSVLETVLLPSEPASHPTPQRFLKGFFSSMKYPISGNWHF